MKLAILGTRGVPPEYGGFETFAAELGARLARRGHGVTVYCRRGGLPSGQVAGSPKSYGQLGNPATRQPDHWNGIRRIVLPSLPGKYLETVTHTFVSALDALRRDFDVVLLCNAANAFTIPLLRAGRIPVAINVDGIERKRRKWNIAGQAFYAAGEAFAATFASAVVADAEVIAKYYRDNYGIEPAVIPYGAEFPRDDDSDVLARLGLASRGYILYVSRFEAENNPLEVVLAYEKLKDAPPLVMVGAARYDKALEARLRSHAGPASQVEVRAVGRRGEGQPTRVEAFPSPLHPSPQPSAGARGPDGSRSQNALYARPSGPNVLFPGALYGADYRTLQRNALLYIQATEVGGTHPALIEAMASGGLVVANDTPENREVGGDAIRYFQLRPSETLSGTLRECLPSADRDELWRGRARRRAAERFGWEAVTDAYERLLTTLS